MRAPILLSITAFCVAACATPYTPIPYDREAAGVRKILVIEDALPKKPTTQKLATNGQNISSAAGGAGGIAGLLITVVAASVEAGVESNQRNRIWAILDAQDFDGEVVFDRALEAALTDAGYEYEEIVVEREQYGVFHELEDNMHTESDVAVLDISSTGYGYQRVGGQTQWRPFMHAVIRLTDATDPEMILMENKIIYNPVGTPDVIVNLPVDEQYAFDKVSDMEADPELTVKGLEAAIVSTANAAAQMLK